MSNARKAISRQQFEIVTVSRSKNRAITPVKSADARNIQTFEQSHERCIREIEGRILILLHDLLHPNQVSVGKCLYLKPGTGASKYLNCTHIANTYHCHIEQLSQNWCRNNPDKTELKETILALRAEVWSYREIGRGAGLHWTRVGQILKTLEPSE
jgi:hypothetical protein